MNCRDYLEIASEGNLTVEMIANSRLIQPTKPKQLKYEVAKEDPRTRAPRRFKIGAAAVGSKATDLTGLQKGRRTKRLSGGRKTRSHDLARPQDSQTVKVDDNDHHLACPPAKK